VYVCIVFGIGIGLEGLIARLCSRVVTGRDTWTDADVVFDQRDGVPNCRSWSCGIIISLRRNVDS